MHNTARPDYPYNHTNFHVVLPSNTDIGLAPVSSSGTGSKFRQPLRRNLHETIRPRQCKVRQQMADLQIWGFF